MLFIARHGQTDWNKARRYQARTDVPVNATGRAQAGALKALFLQRSVRFSSAVCSPLGRAVETAAILLEGTGIEARVEPSFLEIDLGQWEGRYGADLEAEYGDVYTRWRNDCYPTACPGGESMGELIVRVRDAARAIAETAASNDVLIVAHQATNIAIKAALSGDTGVDALRVYRQSNDEVDVWDPVAERMLDRLTVDVPTA